MIIADLEIQSAKFEAGMIQCFVPIKTDRGVVGMSLALKLSEHPELDALVPMIDEALRKACAKSLGLARGVEKNPGKA